MSERFAGIAALCALLRQIGKTPALLTRSPSAQGGAPNPLWPVGRVIEYLIGPLRRLIGDQ
jgi:hypothetical protein